MRIWTIQPNKLCKNHLLGLWREALGCYQIITQDKSGYSNHPQTKQYADCPEKLHKVMSNVRQEMLNRGWNPKPLPERVEYGGKEKVWQTNEEQLKVLKDKGCECKLNK